MLTVDNFSSPCSQGSSAWTRLLINSLVTSSAALKSNKHLRMRDLLREARADKSTAVVEVGHARDDGPDNLEGNGEVDGGLFEHG